MFSGISPPDVGESSRSFVSAMTSIVKDLLIILFFFSTFRIHLRNDDDSSSLDNCSHSSSEDIMDTSSR
jgi:hypothetical protein